MVFVGIYFVFIRLFSDVRTQYWFLDPTPLITLVFALSYLIMCLRKERIVNWMGKPMKLGRAALVYDIIVAGLNFYIGVGLMYEIFRLKYSWVCNHYDYTENTLPIAKYLWWFFFSKHIEFLDTVFMILRHKLDQVSLLHVYHHFSMPIFWWIGVRIFLVLACKCQTG